MAILIWILIAMQAGAVHQDAAIEENGLRQLLGIRRLYVDRLTGGETAAQMRELLLSSLESAKLFVITENQDRADAILRGGAGGPVFNDAHVSEGGRTRQGQSGEARS